MLAHDGIDQGSKGETLSSREQYVDPLVTIFVPGFSHVRYIAECLESIARNSMLVEARRSR